MWSINSLKGCSLSNGQHGTTSSFFRMFKARFTSVNILKNAVRIIKERIRHAMLVANQDGLFLESMDETHVTVVGFHLDSEAAEMYECGNKTYKWGIDFDVFFRILSTSSAKGTCTLTYDDEDEPDVVKITFQSDRDRSCFQMKLCDIDSDQIGIPDDMEHRCNVTVDTRDLERIVKDLSTFSEDVTIVRQGKTLMFSSVGDAANGCVEMQCGDNFRGKLSRTFSLHFLAWFSKASVMCDTAILSIDENFPLLLHYKSDLLSFRFFASPKTVDDDDANAYVSFSDDDVDENTMVE